MKLPHPKPKQLTIWCKHCNGTGVVKYINLSGRLVTVNCPVCKATKK